MPGFLRRVLGSSDGPNLPKLAPAYAGLRSMVLGLDPAKVGPSRIADLAKVLGVVVDWSVGNGFGTFVALADGTASMYTSSGGGTIGAAGRPEMDAAGERLLRTVEKHLDRFGEVGAPGPPVVGSVVYWVLTRDGVRAVAHDASGPPAGDAALAELGAAFQDYVTAFRLVDGGR